MNTLQTPKTGPQMVDLLAKVGVTDQRVISTKKRGTDEFSLEIWEEPEGAGVAPLNTYLNKIERLNGVHVEWSDDHQARSDGRIVFVAMTLSVAGQVSICDPPAESKPQEAATNFGESSQPLAGASVDTKACMALGFPVPRAIVPYTGIENAVLVETASVAEKCLSKESIPQPDYTIQDGEINPNVNTMHVNPRTSAIVETARTYQRARYSHAISDRIEFDAALDEFLDAGYSLRDLRRVINRGGTYV